MAKKAKTLNQLARQGLLKQKKINKLTDELNIIKEEIKPHLVDLAGEKQSHSHPTKDGAVEYKRQESLKIIKGKEVELKEILGDHFIVYFDERTDLKPKTRPLKSLIEDQTSDLGREVNRHLNKDVRESVGFKPVAV